MSSIYNSADDLVAILKETGNTDYLTKLFELRVAQWKYPMVYVECGTTGIFDDLTNFKMSFMAFNLIPSAVQIILNQKDVCRINAAISLLSTLITESNTTEIPQELILQHSKIKSLLSVLGNRESFDAWEHICNWYRIHEWKI